MSTLRRTAVPALAVALAVGFTPGIAGASGGGGGVQKSGACSGHSDWKLKAKHDNGRIEVEYEVDSNVVGQHWQVRLLDNGSTFFQGSRRTTAPSGSFEVRAFTADRAGADHIVGTARNPATGETCRGALSA